MHLNAEDGGNRKFIMVQLPEQTDAKSEAYKAGYQKYRDKLAEYQTAYWKSKTMLAEFAPKVSKMLQVENGMKFETTAKNEKMEEIPGKPLQNQKNMVI